MKKIAIFLILAGILQSCIPTRKLVYLQDDGTQPAKEKTVEYRFKKGDQIYIDIKTRDEALNKLLGRKGQNNVNAINGQNLYFTSYLVDKNGRIELPVLGKIDAAGKTADELKKDIQQKLLATQLRNPQDLYVKVLPAGIFVTVLGEVGHTGNVYLFKQNPNILEVLAEAGDIQLTGDRRHVTVIRTLDDGTKEIGQLDLTKRAAMNSPFFRLKNNDIVYVKPLPQKTIGTGTTLIQTLTTLMSITSFALSLYLFTRK